MTRALVVLLLVGLGSTAAARLTRRQFRQAECVVACGFESSARLRRRCVFDPTACGPVCSTTTTSTTTTSCPCASTTTTTLPPCR